MCLEELRQFKASHLNVDQIAAIKAFAAKCRRDILQMIANSGSGHIGGSLSSIDIYAMLWLCLNVTPENLNEDNRDRIVISHGHTSAAIYSVLGNSGYFDPEEALKNFRKEGSNFEGHPCIEVPGVEWCSGSLGQGLSVGCGFALAAKIKKQGCRVFVVMGDGEQAKGQIQEAREFAAKYGLDNLTAVVDYNRLQASGTLGQVMPQNIVEKYKAAGWKVIRINGHDYSEMYLALRTNYLNSGTPALILAETVMGKGVSFIENKYAYHGKQLSDTQYLQAVKELCNTADCNGLKNGIDGFANKNAACRAAMQVEKYVDPGLPFLYRKGEMVDCRTAFGKALFSLAEKNRTSKDVRICVLDCDLAESVKLEKIAVEFPESFVECGIQEHNAATVAGALSRSGVLAFIADFGVFGIDEAYGQHRMNDLNHTSIKLVCTHNGLDVGEDGKTHQCIDYISLISNLFGFEIILPADANQTDRAIRYAATKPGNIAVMMGRSRVPVLTDENGDEKFSPDYRFEYGNADWLRKGKDATIITCGNMAFRAVNAHEKLKKLGIAAGVLSIACPLQLDADKVGQAAATGLIVTYEDHNIRTGLGSIIAGFLAERGLSCNFKKMGITKYGVSASPGYQYKFQSLDEDSLVDLVVNEIKYRKSKLSNS